MTTMVEFKTESRARVARLPASAAEQRPRRPLVIRLGKRLRRIADRLIASSSLVPNDAVLDPHAFPWMNQVQSAWREIREEALTVTKRMGDVPALRAISPDHARIASDDRWRSFFLVGYGARIEDNIRRCPKTMEVIERIPGLNSGFFSILEPGAHIPRHRGVTKGLITCHLGLSVPMGRSLRMTVGDQTVGWSEGGLLVFDDTYPHEVWNGTDEVRIVLLLQFERPMRQPGRGLSRLAISMIRQSAFVTDAVKNIRALRR